jgi:1-deoxyxylulose-5-phosphate synthase
MNMQFKQFGRTGLSVSRLCLGTGTFGHQTGEAEAFRILDAAADPAGALPHEVGSSEEITGRWLKGKRGKFILGTKAGGSMGPSAWDKGASRKHLLDAIDASLRRLSTDYVDLHQLHNEDPTTPLDETAETLDLIVRSGKVHYIGVSNFLAYRLARAIGRQDTLRLVRFVSAQPRYNLLFREIERELLPLAQEEGLAVIPYNPLAGGLLTGRYRRDDDPDRGRFSAELGEFGAAYRARYWREREFDTLEQLRAIATASGQPLPKLAIAWILANSAITSVILGASRSQQLEDTLAAADYSLAPELKAELDDLTAEYRRGDAGR